MGVIAIGVRSLFLLMLVVVVARKVWPGDMLSTPLAQLTLGTILFGLIKLALGLSIEGFLVWRLVSLPDKENRWEWEGAWVVFGLMLAFFLAFPFFYIDSGKKNALADFFIGGLLTTYGWLIS